MQSSGYFINNKTKVSLSIDYRMISATLSFTPKFFSGNKDNDLKGNSLIQTSASDFSLKDLSRLFITKM